MSVEPQIPREEYLGSDSTDTYTYHFEVSKPEELHVYKKDDEGGVSRLSPGTDFLVLGIDESGADIDPLVGDDDGGPTGIGDIEGGKIKLLAGNLPAGFKLIILRVIDIGQPIPLRENRAYFAKIHEQALDRSIKIDQQQQEQIDRAIKLSPTVDTGFDTTLPPMSPSDLIMVNEAGTGFIPVGKDAFKGDPGDAGAGVPLGGDGHSVLEKVSATDGDADWSAPVVYSGISQLTGQQFDSAGIKETLDKIIRITYTPPLISLVGSSNILREKGDVVSGITLTANVTKKSDPIKEVRIFQNPSTLLETFIAGGAIPSGGSNAHNFAGSFDDNITFRAEVDDDGTTGGPSTVQSTTTYQFVLGYYLGAGSPGLSAASVENLTKLVIQSNANLVRTIVAGAGEVFYFAYPASYGALTSILDVNGFETFPDWTLRTESITNDFGVAASYRIYEFSNPVSAGSYQFTFKR